MENNLDKICDALLKHLLNKHQNCKNLEKLPVGIRDLTKELKQFTGEQVKHALDYLIQADYIKEVYKERETRGNVKERVHLRFKISDLGISKYERPVIFSPNDKYICSINIQNLESLSIIGKNNAVVVHNMHKAFGENIEKSIEEIQNKISKLTDDQIELISLIKSVESMLIYKEPDPTVLQKIKDKIDQKIVSLPADLASSAIITSILHGIAMLISNTV